MKVNELIKLLSKYDKNLEVICNSEDSNLVKENEGSITFVIESVDKKEAEKVRINEVTPSLKFINGPNSESFVIINITSDF